MDMTNKELVLESLRNEAAIMKALMMMNRDANIIETLRPRFYRTTELIERYERAGHEPIFKESKRGK